jgi:hypothetical protein
MCGSTGMKKILCSFRIVILVRFGIDTMARLVLTFLNSELKRIGKTLSNQLVQKT